MSDSQRIIIELPDWHGAFLKNAPAHIPDQAARMQLVLDAAMRNVERGTGGPFAAGVFEVDSGRLVSLGVNRVVAAQVSSAHAEVVGLSLAQQALGSFDLGAAGMPAHELVISAAPCAMCTGAIPWSGVRRVVVSVPAAVVEAITGFDEGPIHPNWQQEFSRRGITTVTDLLLDQGTNVLQEYVQRNLTVYNARQGD